MNVLLGEYLNYSCIYPPLLITWSSSLARGGSRLKRAHVAGSPVVRSILKNTGLARRSPKAWIDRGRSIRLWSGGNVLGFRDDVLRWSYPCGRWNGGIQGLLHSDVRGLVRCLRSRTGSTLLVTRGSLSAVLVAGLHSERSTVYFISGDECTMLRVV